jgi:hypothetical protein
MLIRRILMFLGLPDPDPLVRGTDLDPDPSVSYKWVERTEIMLAKEKNKKNLAKILFFQLKIMCLRVSYKKIFCIRKVIYESQRSRIH